MQINLKMDIKIVLLLAGMEAKEEEEKCLDALAGHSTTTCCRWMRAVEKERKILDQLRKGLPVEIEKNQIF